jgi:energy-coupling factor transporter ATP-binding protein EcfA2
VVLTEFVGRQSETAAIKEALGKHRCVVLTGPAGIGKTRLAVAIGGLLSRSVDVRYAAMQHETSGDGIHWRNYCEALLDFAMPPEEEATGQRRRTLLVVDGADADRLEFADRIGAGHHPREHCGTGRCAVGGAPDGGGCGW